MLLPVLYSAADPTVSPWSPPVRDRRPKEQPMSVLDEITADQIRTDLPELETGDTVRVAQRVRAASPRR
jgi:hypothetical protein